MMIVCLGLGAMLWIQPSSEATDIMEREVEIFEVDSDDLPALREWTERWCRGWRLEDLAASLGVDGTIESVGGYLGRNLPDDARRVVMEVCERELATDNKDADGSP